MSIARKNLGPRLLSGALKPRPGMYGTPRREAVAHGPMASSEAVERVANLTAGGMNFYVAFRQVMDQLLEADHERILAERDAMDRWLEECDR